jgi:photosystem II stability/assembly factor-like uncharacterized protein
MKVILPLLLLVASTMVSAQWRNVQVPTTASLRGLSAAGHTVWASGTQGTVIRTLDQGKTWSVFTVPGAEKLDFRGIHAFNPSTAVIMSSGPAQDGQARIYRTSDGGKTWTQVYEEKTPGVFFDAIVFWDRKHGIVLSDPVDGHFALFRTDDGGKTWAQIPPTLFPPALSNEGAFAASNSCLTVQGKRNVWFATGGASVARVFHSADRGKTWTVAETPMHPANASSGIFSITFRNETGTETFGVAVGGDYAHPEGSVLPNVMFTEDGGRSWQAAASPTDPGGMYFSSVAVLPGVGIDLEDFIAVGSKGTRQIAPRTTRFSGAQPGPASTEDLNSVAVVWDEKRAVTNLWAVGPKGQVVHRMIQYNSR